MRILLEGRTLTVEALEEGEVPLLATLRDAVQGLIEHGIKAPLKMWEGRIGAEKRAIVYLAPTPPLDQVRPAEAASAR